MGFFSDLAKNIVTLPFDVAEGITREVVDRPAVTVTTVTCPACSGKGGTGFGRVAGQECSTCSGTGVVEGK